MTKSISPDLDELVAEHCNDPEFTARFLTELLQDDSKAAYESFLANLGRVARAHGIAELTEEMGLSPKALYISLSEKGNPTLRTFLGLMRAMGLQLSATPVAKPTRMRAAAPKKAVVMGSRRRASGRTRKAPA